MKKSNGNQSSSNDRSRDAEGRFTSEGGSHKASKSGSRSSNSKSSSNSSNSNSRCRDDMGRFESCDN